MNASAMVYFLAFLVFGLLPNVFSLTDPTVFHYPRYIVLTTATVIIVLAGLFQAWKRISDFKMIVTLPDLLIVSLLAIYGVSTIFSVSWYAGLWGDWQGSNQGGLVLMFSLALIYYYFRLVSSPTLLRVVAWIIIVGLAYSYIWGLATGSSEDFYGWLPIRTSAVEFNPVSYAIYLSVGLPLSWILVLKTSGWQRWISLSIMLLLSVGMILSLTRSAWIGMGVVVFILLVILRRNQQLNWRSLVSNRLCWVIAGVVTVLGIYLWPVIYSRVTATFIEDPIYNSGHIRLSEYRTALAMTVDYWATGTGPDTISYVYPRYRTKQANLNQKEWNAAVSVIRNYYLQLSSTIGVFGLLVFAGIVILAITRLKAEVTISTAIFLAWLSISIQYLLSAATLVSQVMFWALLGLWIGSSRLSGWQWVISWSRWQWLVKIGLAVVLIAGLGFAALNSYSQIIYAAVFNWNDRVIRIDRIDQAVWINPYNLQFRLKQASYQIDEAQKLLLSQSDQQAELFTRLDQAQSNLDFIQLLDPAAPKVLYEQAYLSYIRLRALKGLDRQDQIARALIDAQRAAEADPTNPQKADLMTLVYLESDGKKLTEAEASARRSIELMPTFIPGFHHLAEALKQQGKWDQAITSYNQALKIDPTDRVAKSELEKLYILNGQEK